MCTMEEDVEYDSFSDDGFDEAFADLIDSLNDVETRRYLSHASVIETEPSELSADSNRSRTATPDASPFERFRKRRGTLSVASLKLVS